MIATHDALLANFAWYYLRKSYGGYTHALAPLSLYRAGLHISLRLH
jgi:hypothetical protein